MTMIWSAGLTVHQVAKQAGCSENHVRLAATNGALDDIVRTGRIRVSRMRRRAGSRVAARLAISPFVDLACNCAETISVHEARADGPYRAEGTQIEDWHRRCRARRRLRIFPTMCLPSQRERLHRARSGTACPCIGATIPRCAGRAELARDRRDTAQHRAGRHQAPAVASWVLHRAGSARTWQID